MTQSAARLDRGAEPARRSKRLHEEPSVAWWWLDLINRIWKGEPFEMTAGDVDVCEREDFGKCNF